MKKIFIVILIVLFYANVFAESVFLKNGSIIEGTIINETDKNIKIKMTSNLETKIPRKRILRTLYHDKYKKIKYIKLLSGEIIKGHIILEGKSNYIIRKDLKNLKEITLSIDKVDGIFRKQPSLNNSLTKNNSNYEYHSPGMAAFSSILPFWSGSWNNGFDGIGLAFVAAKVTYTTLFFPGLLRPVPLGIQFAGLSLLYIIDMVYAYNVIDNYNINNSNRVSFNILPRIERTEKRNNQYSYVTDGINIQATYKF